MNTYGCESWVLREREKARLQATTMSVLRKAAGVTRLDCIRSEHIRCRLQQRSIVETCRRVGRIGARVKGTEKPGSLVEQIMTGEVEGRRSQGRPRKRWRDVF